MNLKERSIGVIGLGQMGGGIARNLVKAGFSVIGYDLKPEMIERLAQAGGAAAESNEDLVARADVVLLSVEGKTAIKLCDEVVLPNARPGQIVIDHSTVPVPQTKRIGQAFTKKGVDYLDAPVSGGWQGADQGTLRVFVGGSKEILDACWPLFEAIANPDKVVYGGPIGSGQTLKIVQQLTNRLTDVARMEVISFGVRAGLDLELVRRAVDVEPDARDRYAHIYRLIRDGQTDQLGALFSEWAYYLESAEDFGFRMPMLETMYEFCKDGPLTSLDPLARPQPSIWDELMTKGWIEE